MSSRYGARKEDRALFRAAATMVDIEFFLVLSCQFFFFFFFFPFLLFFRR
jgi:hypothetical protein